MVVAPPRSLPRTLFLFVVVVVALVRGQQQHRRQQQQNRRGAGFLQRFLSTLSSPAADGGSAPGHAAGSSGASASIFDAVESREAFFQQLMHDKASLSPVDILGQAVKSKGFKLILDDATTQQRILEVSAENYHTVSRQRAEFTIGRYCDRRSFHTELPFLRAMEGFRDVGAGTQASTGQAASSAFSTGVSAMMAMARETEDKVKDPTVVVDVVRQLAASEENKELFRRIKGGDRAAVKELQHLVGRVMFPGLDMGVLDDVAANQSVEKMLSQPEVMRFIDMDPHVSSVLRASSSSSGGGGGGGSGDGAAAIGSVLQPQWWAEQEEATAKGDSGTIMAMAAKALLQQALPAEK